MYDLIGDIHGYAEPLASLLRTMGYEKHGGIYSHPERKAIFLGDFIDRGPQIRETLELVRPMVDSGAAMAVMGNHELNALAFHTAHPSQPGDYLRPHNEKNWQQHSETVRQVPAHELQSYLGWFRTLPLWLDLNGLRVVHACWDGGLMDRIRGAVTDEFLYDACLPNGPLFQPVEAVLKGKEAALPEGTTVVAKDGHTRTHVRIRWFLPTEGHTYRSYAMEPIDCNQRLTQSVIDAAVPYPANDKPVFIGHYWMRASQPTRMAPNVACVDWSVAKGGFLCAYRWDGEQTLDDSKFVWASS
jgi:hypothetical protein